MYAGRKSYKKKTYKKKTSSKKKYKKSFKGKARKVPDQRWTRIEYEDTHQGSGPSASFAGNGNVKYIGLQNTGGMIPVTRVLAGSIIRDILSKNGIKYATWNSSAEGATGGQNIYTQRCGRIAFTFRGQGVGGELVERQKYMKDGVETDTVVVTYKNGPLLRSLWDITEEFREMLVDSAHRGFYPVSYEVQTYSAVDTGGYSWVTKFRDPNFAMSSVNISIYSELVFTNQTPAINAGIEDKYNVNRTDTVPLECFQYKFRNLAPFFRDDVLTATNNPLPDGSLHPFRDMHEAQKMSYDNGILDLSKWEADSELFRPLSTPPNGAVVFKNCAARYPCGNMPAGGMQKKGLSFKYTGGLRSFLIQTVPQTMFYVAPSPTSDGVAKALLNRVSKGDSYVFAFNRIKSKNMDLISPDVKVSRKITTACYVQPFKSAPLPTCKNVNPDFTSDPKYE